MTPYRSLARLAGALVAGLCVAGLAHAGPLRASASLTSDPAGVVSVEAPAGSAYAAYPSAANPIAEATAGRRHLVVDTGSSPSFGDKYGASADVSTPYALWNLAENRPLTAAEALGITLSFNFNLSGITGASGSANERAVTLSGGLTFNAFPFAVGFGDNASLTQDPFGVVQNGNAALIAGVVDADYHLLHASSATGTVGFALSSLSALAATTMYDLWLESVTLVPEVQTLVTGRSDGFLALGSAVIPSSFDLGMGLGVRLLGDDGELIVVVPTATPPNGVPAPATAWLALGGLALMRRRRQPH